MTKWSYACTHCHQAQCKCKQTTATAIKPRPQRGANARGYTYRWQQASKVYLVNNPLCVRCESLGKVEAAAHVDHVVPHRGDVNGDAFWDEANWQALCARCHGWKTQREAGMGKRIVICLNDPDESRAYAEDQAGAGDLIWSRSQIISQLAQPDEQGNTKASDLDHLIECICHAFVNWIRTEASQRNIWIIAENPIESAKIARKIGGLELKNGGGGLENKVLFS